MRRPSWCLNMGGSYKPNVNQHWHIFWYGPQKTISN